MPAVKKMRADQLLAEQGLAESREKARRLIMAGRVLMTRDGREEPVDKPGRQLSEGTPLIVREGERFVGRGAYKLLTALEHFHIDVTGKTVLDVGASTGGFTDCLLQHGAARVYSTDVGRGLLDAKLRSDPRVVVLEGVNLRHAGPDLLPEPVDMVVADVSFISLTLILPPCMQWLKTPGEAVVLVKPQFEVGPGRTHKGVVRDPAVQLEAVDGVARFVERELGLFVAGSVPAAIKGPKGNQEYLLRLLRKEISSQP
jgi:23S rRNA (cytidine1920-2'-O)/16S rRNA (cytidine1409-2'-O)-methyltransferase